MLKKMKKQPLLFVELLFWKTRRECHYINAEYLLSELGHLKKESANWNNTQGDEEIGSSPTKVWTQDIKSKIKPSKDKLYVIKGFAPTSGTNSDKDDHNGEQLMEYESQIALRRRKKLVLDGDLERQIKDLHEK
ncbi:hypothetical protein JHK82_048536 [Glycine max]|nr:hypothetical protein JHK86_048392 [Glycine max]KAG4944386.1 hypothetical protein JHK85_049032 [Glycine max]KAG5098682.1 hypothetical protein JHK82_048536 [Glycine max]